MDPPPDALLQGATSADSHRHLLLASASLDASVRIGEEESEALQGHAEDDRSVVSDPPAAPPLGDAMPITSAGPPIAPVASPNPKSEVRRLSVKIPGAAQKHSAEGGSGVSIVAGRKELDVEVGRRDETSSVTTNAELCAICLGRIVDRKTLRCGHSFCTHCIEQWMEQKPSCPKCRRRTDRTGDESDSSEESHRPWSCRVHWPFMICVGTLCFVVTGIVVWLIVRAAMG